MPFITEEIRQAIGLKDLLITSRWPSAGTPGAGTAEDLKAMETLLRIVEVVRSIRGEYTLPPSQSTDLIFSADEPALRNLLAAHGDILGNLDKVIVKKVEANAAKPAFSAAGIVPGGRVFIPLEGILDPAQEKVRLTKELGKAEGFLVAQEKKLSNEGFVKSAPAEVVEGERAKLQTQKDRVAKLKAALADLG
jgi:valyl-tRNA synthetase